MRALTSVLVAVLASPLAVVAAPTGNTNVAARQAPVKPTPCVRQDPSPSEEETAALFDDFVDKFVGENKSIAKAFEYIAEDYIVR